MTEPNPDATALQRFIADATGIALDPTQAQAVAAAVARMRDAVAATGVAPDFDLPIDRYYQLLEAGAPGEDG